MSALQAQQQAGQQPPAAPAAAKVVAPPAEGAPAQGQPPQQQAQQQAEKKDKKKEEQPGQERPPGKCQFFLEKKRRFCKFDVVPGKRFCGNHLFEGEGSGPRRVPCPWDPRAGHTVLESELEKHKFKCPGYLQAQARKEQPFYSEDINAGSADAAVVWPPGLQPLEAPGGHAGGSASGRQAGEGQQQEQQEQQQEQQQQQQQQQQQRSGPRGHAAMQAAFAASLGEQRFEELLRRVEAACDQICEPEPLSVLVPPAAEPLLLPESANEHRRFSLKHAQQQASIVGNMQARGLLQDAGEVTYIEYGAGKGYLSEMLAACSVARKLVVMDVRGFKHKADRGMRHLELQRLRCDIKDFDVAQVAGLQGGAAPWVAIGKHLCGAATDFTLRSCARELQRRRRSGEQVPAGGGVRGLAVATCCHHRCCWQHFVAQEEMLQLGFSPQEFEVIAWMTGWALCGHEVPAGCGGDDAAGDEQQAEQGNGRRQEGQMQQESQREGQSHLGQKRGWEEASQPAPAHPAAAPPAAGEAAEAEAWRPQAALPRARKIAIGGRCKRLIDAARLRWLRRQGFASTELVQYVSPAVSGENRLLLAAAAPGGHQGGASTVEAASP